MKSNLEINGLTVEEEKQERILCKLMMYFYDQQKGEPKNDASDIGIKRYDMRLKVVGAAYGRAVDRLTFFKHVETLLIQNLIVQNPTSHITPNEHILPNNDTRYIINGQKVIDEWQRLIHKRQVFLEKRQKENNILSVSSIQLQLNTTEPTPQPAPLRASQTECQLPL